MKKILITIFFLPILYLSAQETISEYHYYSYLDKKAYVFGYSNKNLGALNLEAHGFNVKKAKEVADQFVKHLKTTNRKLQLHGIKLQMVNAPKQSHWYYELTYIFNNTKAWELTSSSEFHFTVYVSLDCKVMLINIEKKKETTLELEKEKYFKKIGNNWGKEEKETKK